MKFSELFEIQKDSGDNWFDPILSLDTKLFIDPFLIYASEDGFFKDSHIQIIEFFNQIFKLIAKSNGKQSSVIWRKAVSLLRMPEAEGLCLGYTKVGTGGSGSGLYLAKIIAEAIWEAIQSGTTQIEHFEEISILREGIGADRISDTTTTILKERIVKYTQDVCIKHRIPIERRKFLQGYFNKKYEIWMPIEADLPINPYNEKAIFLVPKKYLRDLPTINADDFWEYCFSNENETLRDNLSYDITKNVDKKTIVKIAKKIPDLREKYLKRVEEAGPEAYNFEKDKKGLVKWYGATKQYCGINPLYFEIKNTSDFLIVIDAMIKEFCNYVENNKGWRLLWNENKTPRREDSSQDLFLGIVKHYCKANDIDISREANIGRGPVDFKVSYGYKLRTLIEVKLAKNTKFWNGLEKQLPKYQQAEDVNIGYFLVVCYTDKDYEKIQTINKRIGKVNAKTGYEIHPVIVDASYGPVSASKL